MVLLAGIPAAVFSLLGSITALQWISALLVASAWLYWHMTKDFGKWEAKGLHAVKPSFPFGSNKDMILGKVSFTQHHMNVYEQLKEHG